MTGRLAAALAAIFMLAVLAAGCGSSGSSSGSSDTATNATSVPAATATTEATTTEADKGEEKDKGEEGRKSSCKKPAAKQTGLPSSFPAPARLTITGSEKEGPTTIANGYWSGGLDGAYVSLKAAVTGAGYQLGHTEKDEHDSEIEYEGGGREGQIALRETCSEDGLLRVRISSRPK